MRSFHFGFVVALLSGAACSSSSSNTGTTGGTTTSGGGSMCSGLTSSSKPVYTSATKAAGSDANCPDLSPGMFNSMGGDDAGSNDCPPTITGCMATIDCMSGGGRVTGSFTVSGSTFSGRFSVMVAGITCGYDVAGNVQ